MKKNQKSGFSELRARAEHQLRMQQQNRDSFINNTFIQELHIRQLELELQNEELQNTRQRLEQFNLNYLALFDHAPIAYFILDKKGLICDVNYSGSEQFGMEKSKLKGKHFSLFISSPTCQDNFYMHANMALETGKSEQLECEMKRHNNTVFCALLKTTIVKDENGNFKHFLLMVADISEQKRERESVKLALAKEKELSDLKSDFITLATHEFRTPLAVIFSSSDLIEAYIALDEKEKQLKQISKIKKAVFTLKDIVADFMFIKELEELKIINEPVSFDFIEAIQEVIEIVTMENAKCKIDFFPGVKSKAILLDKRFFKICVNNILNNAIKYSLPESTIRIRTEVNLDADNLKIVISDNGIGIPKEDQDKIFEQFFRAKNVTNFKGMGVGLSIVRKLVTLMGGEVYFVSEENKQTTFSLVFNNCLT